MVLHDLDNGRHWRVLHIDEPFLDVVYQGIVASFSQKQVYTMDHPFQRQSKHRIPRLLKSHKNFSLLLLPRIINDQFVSLVGVVLYCVVAVSV